MKAIEDKTGYPETSTGQKERIQDKLAPLSVRHERVMGFLLVGETQTEAYRLAYDCDLKTAHRGSTRLMKDVLFKEHLRVRKEVIADKNNINFEWVTEKLKFIVEECLKVGKNFNPGAANKALELIGKNLGMFDKDIINKEERPVWVGMTISTGDGRFLQYGSNGETVFDNKMIEPPIDITPSPTT